MQIPYLCQLPTYPQPQCSWALQRNESALPHEWAMDMWITDRCHHLLTRRLRQGLAVSSYGFLVVKKIISQTWSSFSLAGVVGVQKWTVLASLRLAFSSDLTEQKGLCLSPAVASRFSSSALKEPFGQYLYSVCKPGKTLFGLQREIAVILFL